MNFIEFARSLQQGPYAAAPEHRMVRANGIRLHVVEAGPADGDAVILVHGFPDFWWGWHKVIGPLVEHGLRVIALDMRGYGSSDAPGEVAAYVLDQLAADVIDVADALGIARFQIAGHDWGGVVAWAVAARHPARVARLIAIAAPHPDTFAQALRMDPRQILRSAYAAFFRLPVLPEVALAARRFALLRRALRASALCSTFARPEMYRYVDNWRGPGRLRAMLNYYRAAWLPRAPIGRVTVTTIILWGGRDPYLGVALADLAHQMCDQAALHLIASAGHWMPHENASLLVDMIATNIPSGARARPSGGAAAPAQTSRGAPP